MTTVKVRPAPIFMPIPASESVEMIPAPVEVAEEKPAPAPVDPEGRFGSRPGQTLNYLPAAEINPQKLTAVLKRENHHSNEGLLKSRREELMGELRRIDQQLVDLDKVERLPADFKMPTR